MNNKTQWESLIKEYLALNNSISAYQFCKEKNLDNSKFYRTAKLLNLEIRQRVYQIDKSLVLDPVEKAKLEGHLLGDGSVFYVDSRKKLPAFAIVSKHKSYLEWIVKESKWANERPIWIRNQYDSRTTKTYKAYWLRSLSSQFLKEQRERWYPEGIKLVPKDLILTKDSLVRWYMDDGCFYNQALFLSTDGFTKSDIEYLAVLLELHNFNPTLTKNGNGYRISFTRKQSREFLEYIGPCPTECFSYKWERKG